LLYKPLKLIRLNKKFKIFVQLIDGIYVIFLGFLFLSFSHLFFGGEIYYYSVLSYLGGILLVFASFNGIQKLLKGLLKRV
jgi:hypothetical protein